MSRKRKKGKKTERSRKPLRRSGNAKSNPPGKGRPYSGEELMMWLENAPPEPVFSGNIDKYTSQLKDFRKFLEPIPRKKDKLDLPSGFHSAYFSSYYSPDQYIRRSAYAIVTFKTIQRLGLRSRNSRRSQISAKEIMEIFETQYSSIIEHYTSKGNLHGRTNKNPFNLVLRDFIQNGLLRDKENLTSRYARAYAYAHNFAIEPLFLDSFIAYVGGIDTAATMFSRKNYDLGWVEQLLPMEAYLDIDGSLAGDNDGD